jgi:hypothetical protein
MMNLNKLFVDKAYSSNNYTKILSNISIRGDLCMKHPIEKLFDINIYSEPEKHKAVNAILSGLNKSWKQDLNVAEVSKDDLLKMLGPHRDLKNLVLIDEVLDYIINSFRDPETLAITVNNLKDKDHRHWATILAGFYGKKARRAIPWIRYYMGGQAFPNDAEFALRHIGMSKKVLYTGLRIAIREGDPEGFLRLLDFMKFEYPGYQADLEFKKILDSASRRQNLHIRRGAVLTALSEMSLEVREQFNSILQRLLDDRDDSIREIVSKLLNSEKV